MTLAGTNKKIKVPSLSVQWQDSSADSRGKAWYLSIPNIPSSNPFGELCFTFPQIIKENCSEVSEQSLNL